MSPPLLFDRLLQRARMARAQANAKAGADFLLSYVARGMQERLHDLLVFRDYAAQDPSPLLSPHYLDLGTPGPHLTHLLSNMKGEAHIVCMQDICIYPLPDRIPVAPLVADCEKLPFLPTSFDLILSGLCLHFLNDLPGTLIQIRQCLRAHGLFLACLLGGKSLSTLREAFAHAESECEGGISPRISPFADVHAIGNLLQRASFNKPVAESEELKVIYEDPRHLLRDLRAMGASNSLRQRSKRPLRRQTLERALALYREIGADENGKISASFELLWVSGWGSAS